MCEDGAGRGSVGACMRPLDSGLLKAAFKVGVLFDEGDLAEPIEGTTCFGGVIRECEERLPCQAPEAVVKCGGASDCPGVVVVDVEDD